MDAVCSLSPQVGVAKWLPLAGPRPLPLPPGLAPLSCPAPEMRVSARGRWVGQQEAPAPANNKPVPVFKNSTRVPDSASSCLLGTSQSTVGLWAGQGVAFSVLINIPWHNGKVGGSHWISS